MKKYRLKKWYPGLPDHWDEGMEVIKGDRPFSGYKPCSTKYAYDIISAYQVQNYPAFWEKVEELCVPIGTKFKTVYRDDCVHTIDRITDDNMVVIRWPSLFGKIKEEMYSVSRVNNNFDTGQWEKYYPEKSSLKEGKETKEEALKYIKDSKLPYDAVEVSKKGEYVIFDHYYNGELIHRTTIEADLDYNSVRLTDLNGYISVTLTTF